MRGRGEQRQAEGQTGRLAAGARMLRSSDLGWQGRVGKGRPAPEERPGPARQAVCLSSCSIGKAAVLWKGHRPCMACALPRGKSESETPAVALPARRRPKNKGRPIRDSAMAGMLGDGHTGRRLHASAAETSLTVRSASPTRSIVDCMRPTVASLRPRPRRRRPSPARCCSLPSDML